MQMIAFARVLPNVFETSKPNRIAPASIRPSSYQLEMDLGRDNERAQESMIGRLSELSDEARWEAGIIRESFDYANELRVKGHLHHAALAEWQASKQARIWIDTWTPQLN